MIELINWFRPKKQKVSHYEKVKIYVSAYAYNKGEYDNGVIIPLKLPPVRDIEYVTGINRQYVLEALTRLIKENWIKREGKSSRTTKFIISDWSEDSVFTELFNYKKEYPELFFKDNPYSRKRYNKLSDEEKKKYEFYETMPNFEAWKTGK